MSVNQVQDGENHAPTSADPLAEANQKIAQMSRDLDALQIEQKLTHKLVAAGVVDLETAVLVAKARLEADPQRDSSRLGTPGPTPADIDSCVAQLRKEKAYLFGGSAETTAPRRIAPARDRMTTGQAALEQAAQQAAKTGRRADLQHYLKLRKNLW